VVAQGRESWLSQGAAETFEGEVESFGDFRVANFEFL
jgi:hypothetical protein